MDDLAIDRPNECTVLLLFGFDELFKDSRKPTISLSVISSFLSVAINH
jgi:hypothetical protein